MDFNLEMETIERELWRSGMQFGHEGEPQWVDTPWAMGFSEKEESPMDWFWRK